MCISTKIVVHMQAYFSRVRNSHSWFRLTRSTSVLKGSAKSTIWLKHLLDTCTDTDSGIQFDVHISSPFTYLSRKQCESHSVPVLMVFAFHQHCVLSCVIHGVFCQPSAPWLLLGARHTISFPSSSSRCECYSDNNASYSIIIDSKPLTAIIGFFACWMRRGE